MEFLTNPTLQPSSWGTTTPGVWEDQTVVSAVPTWATGLFIATSSSNSGGTRNYGIRRVGQTWSPSQSIFGYNGRNYFVQIDENRKINQLNAFNTGGSYYIYGYFGREAGWLNPATQLTASQNQVWETYTFTPSNGDTCAAVLVEVVANTEFGCREKGSSVTITGTLVGGNSFIVPVNGSNQFELKMNSGASAYIVGYLRHGVLTQSNTTTLTVTPLNSAGTYTSPAIPVAMRGRAGLSFMKNIDSPSATNNSSILYHKLNTSFPYGGSGMSEPGQFCQAIAGPREDNGLFYSPWYDGNIATYFYAALSDVAEPPAAKQYPSADITDGGWLPSEGGAELSVMLADNDGDKYIYAREPTTCEVRLPPLIDPVSSTGHAVRCRMWVDGGTRNVKVFLMQGATERASWTQEVTTTATDYTFTLTGTQADSITDYAALRLKFELMT